MMMRVLLVCVGLATVVGKIVGLHEGASDEFKDRMLEKIQVSRVQVRTALRAAPLHQPPAP